MNNPIVEGEVLGREWAYSVKVYPAGKEIAKDLESLAAAHVACAKHLAKLVGGSRSQVLYYEIFKTTSLFTRVNTIYPRDLGVKVKD